MRVLIVGGTGMLGHKLVQELQPELDVWTTVKGRFADCERYGIFDEAKTITGVDAADVSTVEAAIRTVRPQVVVNAVGIIKQLPTAKNVITTLTINSIFPHLLEEMSGSHGFRLITISTDCVFDGQRGNYSEKDVPNALDLYGTSKRLGEVTGPNCLTLRTSIIGRELQTSHSLVEWFLSSRGGSVNGFVNAIYSGYPTITFADIVKRVIVDHPQLHGLYNVSSESINKYDLLQLIKSKFDLSIDIEPETEFRIDRSLDSNLFKSVTGMTPPTWEYMVEQMAVDPTPYDSWRQEPANPK